MNEYIGLFLLIIGVTLISISLMGFFSREHSMNVKALYIKARLMSFLSTLDQLTHSEVERLINDILTDVKGMSDVDMVGDAYHESMGLYITESANLHMMYNVMATESHNIVRGLITIRNHAPNIYIVSYYLKDLQREIDEL